MSTTYTKQQHYKGVGLGSVGLVDEGVDNITRISPCDCILLYRYGCIRSVL